uniref:Uncharacterized protein n=1 Tax=Arundo donax TaxID=35708 RepID=A0A0A9CBN0_ARUDO
MLQSDTQGNSKVSKCRSLRICPGNTMESCDGTSPSSRHSLHSTFKYLSCDSWLLPVRSILISRKKNSRNNTRRNLNSNRGGVHFDPPNMARERTCVTCLLTIIAIVSSSAPFKLMVSRRILSCTSFTTCGSCITLMKLSSLHLLKIISSIIS